MRKPYECSSLLLVLVSVVVGSPGCSGKEQGEPDAAVVQEAGTDDAGVDPKDVLDVVVPDVHRQGPPAVHRWKIEVVDDKGFTGYHASLILDGENHPTIAYLEPAHGRLLLATKSPSNKGWSVERAVDSDVTSCSQLRRHSGRDYIVWQGQHRDRKGLFLVDRTVGDNDSLWITSPIPESTNASGPISLLVRQQDGKVRLQVIYTSNKDSSLYEATTSIDESATGDKRSWNVAPLGDPPIHAMNPVAALGTDGTLYVAHLSTDDWTLKMFVRPDQGPPQGQTIDSSQLGDMFSIALGPDSNPWVAYSRDQGEAGPRPSLWIASYDGSQWNTSVVDDTDERNGQFPSLAFDPGGLPHIAYVGRGALRHAWMEDGEWKIETVDASAEVGQFASLAVGTDGLVRIAYRDVTNGRLKYATQKKQ